MENYPKKLLFSQQEVAILLKITPGAVSQWKLKPVRVRKTSREKLYYLPEVIDYWKSIHSQKKLDLEQERAKLAQQQTAKIKLDIAERKIQLVRVEEVEKAWAMLLGAFRARLLSLPDKLVLALDLQNDVSKRRLIQEMIFEAMSELATCDIEKFYETNASDETSSNEDAEDSSPD